MKAIDLGLTSKLSILLVCIGVGASGVTGYYAYRANRLMLMQEAERSLLTSTQLLSQRFTAALGDVADDVLVLATLPSSIEAAAGKDAAAVRRSGVEQVFSRFMMHHPEYLQIRLITRANHGLERIRVERQAASIVVVAESELREKGQFPYVFGTLSTQPEHVYLSPIGLTPQNGARIDESLPAMTIGAPVVDANGEKIGVLVIDVNLTRMFQRLSSDLHSGYQIYLANEWGDFLIHPDTSQTFGFERGRRVLMQASFPATRALFDGGLAQVTFNGGSASQAGRAGAARQAFAFVRAPFGTVDGNRAIVLGMGRSLANVLASANALGNQIVRMVLIWSACAIALGIVFARAMTGPLRVLADAATHVCDDAHRERLPVSRSDEIGVLARCFERMRREIRSQMKALHAKQQELTHLAGHDALTGLPNRMRFMEQLDGSIRQASLEGRSLAVIFVDLDGFKQINDQFGHSAGDRTLSVVAQRLRAVLAEDDVAGRLGGDEFVILSRHARLPDDVDACAHRVQAAMDEPIAVDLHRMNVGASMGISEFPFDGDTAGELLAKADAAMYAAKTSPYRRFMYYRELTGNGSNGECAAISRLA